MIQLSEQTCTACADSVKLDNDQINDFLLALVAQYEQWQLIEEDGIQQLSFQFITKRYQRTMDFTNQVAELAESVNHHPLMIVEYGRVTIKWWSHNIKGLHQNDFIMAAKTSALFAN